MKEFAFAFFFCLSTVSNLMAQRAGDVILSAQIDLVKTDNLRFFDKTQFGLEANYYATEHITALTGIEIWTDDEISFVIGGRWYPTKESFVRLRGLIGNNDLSLGAGWVKPINNQFHFEAIADFYFQIDFSIRAGLVYRIQ